MTTYCIGSDRSGSVTRVTKSYTWTAALYWRRRLRHMAFPVISLSLSLSLYIYIYISFIYSTRIYLCMYVCMFETYLLRNGWTDLKNSFFVSSVLVRGRFQAKEILDFRKKISRIFFQSFSKILQNVNITIGRSPETPDSGKAARGQRRSGQYINMYV